MQNEGTFHLAAEPARADAEFAGGIGWQGQNIFSVTIWPVDMGRRRLRHNEPSAAYEPGRR